MKIVAALLLIFQLSGCALITQTTWDTVNQLNEMVWGRQTNDYEAPHLASEPKSSGCEDVRCRKLDEYELKGYQLARAKKISWVDFVKAFYKARADMFPDSNDNHGVREIMLYQLMLAEQLDSGKLTEAEWAYRIESKIGEIRARNTQSQHTSTSYNGISTSGGSTQCFFKSEWKSGFNKNCVYDCMGSQAVRTISSVGICPPTTEF